MAASTDLIAVINALVAARIKQGLTQEQVAQRLGDTRQCLSSWERLINFPPADRLFAWAKVLGVRLVLVDMNWSSQRATDNCAADAERVSA